MTVIAHACVAFDTAGGKTLNNNDRNKVFWARENEHPQQTIVLTKIAGQQPGSGHCCLRSSPREEGGDAASLWNITYATRAKFAEKGQITSSMGYEQGFSRLL